MTVEEYRANYYQDEYFVCVSKRSQWMIGKTV